MARLPKPGEDVGTWGTILNEFLATVHNTDGTLKTNSVTAASLAPGAVKAESIVATGGVDGYALIKDSQSPGGVAWRAINSTGTVTKSSLGLGNVDNTSDASKPISTATQAALDAKADKTSFYTKADTDTALATKADISSVYTKTEADDKFALKGSSGTGGATTLDELTDVSSSGATENQALVFNGTEWAPATISSQGAISDATDTGKGIVQLAGDLGGSADAPAVLKVNGIAVSGTPEQGHVLTATGAGAASWAAPATGDGGTPSTGSGGYAFKITPVTANTTAASNDCIMADSTSAAITVTLPAPVANGIVRVKRTIIGGGNSVQVVPPSGVVIDAATVGSDVLNYDFQSQDYWSDGTKWYRV